MKHYSLTMVFMRIVGIGGTIMVFVVANASFVRWHVVITIYTHLYGMQYNQ